MKAVTHFRGRLPVNVRPEIVRLHDSVSLPLDFVCVMPFWSLHFFHYDLRIDIEGEPHQMRPGLALLTPPGVRTHTFSVGGHTMYFAHFYLPENGSTKYADAPVVLDMGDRYGMLDGVFADAAQSWQDNKEKAEIALWYLLQALFQPGGAVQQTNLPGKLALALRVISENLSGLGDIEQLARRVGVSSRHLNRLFRSQFGMTAAEFLREKRLLEAQHYLRSSDHLVKEIGRLVGLPGAQHFNNMIKKRFGLSPQALRNLSRTAEGDPE